MARKPQDQEELEDQTLENTPDEEDLSALPGQIFPPVQGGIMATLPGQPMPQELPRDPMSLPPEEPQILGMPLSQAKKLSEKLSPKKAEKKSEDKPKVFKNKPSKAPGKFSTKDALADAQIAVNNNNLLTNLARAGTQFGAAVASNSTPNYETISAIEKNNKAPVEQHDERFKRIGEDIKLNEQRMDLEVERMLNDPNHSISQAAREAAKKALKMDLPDNVTAAQLDKAGLLKPLLNSMREAGNQYQIIREEGPDGVIRNVRVNKLTGEKSDLGTAGYAMQTRTNPITGELIQLSGSHMIPGMSAQNGTGPKIGQAPELNPVQKKEVGTAIDRVQGSEEYKASQKTLTATDNIRKLLKEAKMHGGQSLAMLGPQVARGIAKEVGQMTDIDVTRYIKNPTLLGGLQDTLLKITEGKLSDVSYDNLTRLIDLMEKDAKINRDVAYSRGAEQLSRSSGLSHDQAVFYLNPESKPASSQMATPQGAPRNPQVMPSPAPQQAPQQVRGPSGLTEDERKAEIARLRAKLGQ